MRFLYYSTSYYASHGGSIQAIEFYNHLDEFKLIEEKSIFPKEAKKGFPGKAGAGKVRHWLKKIPLVQIFLFYRRNKFYLEGLKKEIQDFKPDVVLFQIDSNFLQLKKVKKWFPKLIIATQINGSPFDEPFRNIAFRNFFLKKQRKAYMASDVNFFVSDVSKNQIMGNNVDAQRDIIVPNGTSTQTFFPIENKTQLREQLGYDVQKTLVGYVGTLDYHKKMLLLVKAFADLLNENAQLQLIIIGDGPAHKNITSEVKRLGIEKEVLLKGWIKHDNLNKHLNCFDIAVHHYASDYMNPMKIFEYLAVGLPVLAPDIPSIKETFEDGKDLLITKDTPKEIFKNLKKLVQDVSLRSRLTGNPRILNDLKEKHSWENYTRKIVQAVYEKIKNLQLG
ncbi:glycosyltransferase family 4 protein [Autumnicola edwardsiae]|uniref:Glycosyltransferase family 4 protein n=1 Tax=Autumnicola edwardsiae TaxID=3075594 RepID=A0ABU3CU68_9FLAO|nr:glycosyltransferase family 4 protein [Zunongwangia sp. F297]MDT0649783.1 glycosyltransferase family 4 protein [Zunongwangia sp. F297]